MSKPLTIEELKALPAGDWVWVESDDDPFWNKYYAKKCPFFLDENKYLQLGTQGCGYTLRYSNYGKTWLAYKNKEQAEGKHDEIRKQTAKEIAETIISVLWEEEKDEMIKVKDARKIIKDIVNLKYGVEVDE